MTLHVLNNFQLPCAVENIRICSIGACSGIYIIEVLAKHTFNIDYVFWKGVNKATI